MDLGKFEKKEYFVNRELSWLKFDERVLSEARDKNLPLFDRLKFLSITASNLDEFFMVRVASLKDQVHAGYHKTDIAGMTAKEQLKEISARTHELVHVQYNTLNRSLLPALEKAGMHLVAAHEDLTEEQKAFVDRYFEDDVYPVLTPMAMDSSRPFPLIRNKTLNIGALISKKDKEDKLSRKDKAEEEELLFATVQVPSVLPRVVQIPSKKDGDTTVILLEEIIERNIDKLFLSYDVVCAHPYRIMRNADLTIDEDEAEDLLVEIQRQLKKRQWGEVIRLEVEDKMDERLLKILKMEFDIKEADIFEINGPLDLTMLMKVYGAEGFDAYKTPRYQPAPVPEFQNDKDIFQVIREGDVFLHHPYMSFDPVVNFVRQAAKDPDVLAIKQTLYRVSGNSPIIAALAQAAENGKQVSVLVELKARFDEENNIRWSRMLEQAGCQIIYGLEGYKVHSKLCLITRRSEKGIEYITQIGTGNYNEKTARLYTDLCLMTVNEQIGMEAARVFQALTKGEIIEEVDHLMVAPKCLQSKVIALIDEEIRHKKQGEDAYIGLKLNSLTDKRIIDKLVEASKAGVRVDMIIRGICCMVPGIKGETENVHIISIVGRFLEHSRIYIFGCGERTKYYIGSADFMTRNTVKRVEVAAPVYSEKIKKRIRGLFDLMLSDNKKARTEDYHGKYSMIKCEGQPCNSQEMLYQEAYDRAAIKTENKVVE